MIVSFPRLRHTSSTCKLSYPSNASNGSGLTIAVFSRSFRLVLTVSRTAGTGAGRGGGGSMIGFVADSSVFFCARFRSISFSSNCGAARSIFGLVACCCFMVILFMLLVILFTLRSMLSRRWYIVNWNRIDAMTRMNNVKIPRNDGLLILAPHVVIVSRYSSRHLLSRTKVHARYAICLD